MKYVVNEELDDGSIAIVGTALNFPGANDVEEYWQNIANGVESIQTLDDQQLREAGVDLSAFSNPNYVRRNSSFGRHDLFDASFFKLTPAEAKIIDPQQRLLLELAYRSLENSGYISLATELLTGVFVGTGPNAYLHRNLMRNPDVVKRVGLQAVLLGNDKAYASARIAYKLDLQGPCITVDTACSTGLVAVHQACRSLLDFECDVAIAGASSMMTPHNHGYEYQVGGIFSTDGCCRPFSSQADGTLFASGGAILTMRRLTDAMKSGDDIQAIIRGSAINNDGNSRMGFTAPSMDGQKAVVLEAIETSGVDPEMIRLVECHGTGTIVGDPIEVNALSRAFKTRTEKKNFCALGSVKSNIGHLDAAAGMAGLIKAIMAIRNEQLPPTLHAVPETTAVDFSATPFYVNSELKHWPEDVDIRIAGVSSFGMGGSNAHVIIEQPKVLPEPNKSQDYLFVLTAKTKKGLKQAAEKLAPRLMLEDNISAVSNTLLNGREHHHYRLACVTNELNVVSNSITDGDILKPIENPKLAFLFPGQGSQSSKMGNQLYQSNRVFKNAIEECHQALVSLDAGMDLLHILNINAEGKIGIDIDQTRYAQLGLFCIGYAYAKLLEHHGVEPDYIFGHSSGEYLSAHFAGVFGLRDALRLVVARGDAMQKANPGAMLSLRLSLDEVEQFLERDLWIVADNAPNSIVVGGALECIERAELSFKQRKVACVRLNTSHAFHTPLMHSAQEDFREVLESIVFKPTLKKFASSLYGEVFDKGKLLDVEYWLEQMISPVRFKQGINALKEQGVNILIEVGPSAGLLAFAAQTCPSKFSLCQSITSDTSERTDLNALLAKLWCLGVLNNTKGLVLADSGFINLPGTVFQRESFWLDSETAGSNVGSLTTGLGVGEDPAGIHCYTQEWVEQDTDNVAVNDSDVPKKALIFTAATSPVLQLVSRVEEQYDEVLVVQFSEHFELNSSVCCIRADNAHDFIELLNKVCSDSSSCTIIFANLLDLDKVDDKEQFVIEYGLTPLLHLVRQLSQFENSQRIRLLVLGLLANQVLPDEHSEPAYAPLAGIVKVVRQEMANVRASFIDTDSLKIWDNLFTELDLDLPLAEVATRNNRRFIPRLDTYELSETSEQGVKQGGVYIITGGHGGLGRVLAERLLSINNVKVIILSRSAPDSEEFDEWLSKNVTDPNRVVSFQTDVADETAMQSTFAQVVKEVESIDGVFHVAGVNEFTAVTEVTAEGVARVLNSKIFGTRVLMKLADQFDIDFLVLFSSSAAHIGGFGQGLYCAANTYLDRIVTKLPIKTTLVTINWDVWKDVGMSTHALPPEYKAVQEQRLESGIPVEEGLNQCFAILGNSLLSSSNQSVVVTYGDINKQIQRNQELEKLIEYGVNSGSNSAPINKDPGELEEMLLDLWKSLLGIEDIGIHDSFFELGGDSLMLAQAHRGLTELGLTLPIADLFRYPTIDALVKAFTKPSRKTIRPQQRKSNQSDSKIAIISYAGRFPGARNTEEFWQNIAQGVDCVSTLTDEQLLAAGVPETQLYAESFVRRASCIDDKDVSHFDDTLFDFTPNEILIMDPQQRLFLKCAHETLEMAGYATSSYDGRIGVYGGSAISTYLLNNLFPNMFDPRIAAMGQFQLALGNDVNFLASRVAYKLGATGPAVSLSTACSTSLVAVHEACKSLLVGEADMALAGGVRIDVVSDRGYTFEEGGMLSPDGYCRPFDKDANGTIFGSGCGVVMLKKLEDAMHDGDEIHAVILGSGINNDGGDKIAYTAPSVTGQADLIESCLRDNNIAADTIQYIEAHGTGTELGDPIEIAALNLAFGDHEGQCKIGSVKGNIGHLDAAAGVTGLIKVIESFKHKKIPPSLHYNSANPHLNIEASNFSISNELSDWKHKETARRASVSSFGIGGTNAFLILEEAPDSNVLSKQEKSNPNEQPQLILLSAASEGALDKKVEQLSDYFHSNDKYNLADVAFTLDVGREQLRYRKTGVLAQETIDSDLKNLLQKQNEEFDTRVRLIFLFPGQGAQYMGMCQELYQRYEVFQNAIDECHQILMSINWSWDLIDELIGCEDNTLRLAKTEFVQVSLFACEYGLAKLMEDFGIEAEAAIGHSIGEYSAAHWAGVFSLHDAIALVVARGRAMSKMEPGAMLAVMLPFEGLGEYELQGDVAARNMNDAVVLSGSEQEMTHNISILEDADVLYKKLYVEKAFHSYMLDPVLAEFKHALQNVNFNKPQKQFFSNVTGQLITAEQAMSAEYWVKQARSTVMFSECVKKAIKENTLWLELGPGHTLTQFLHSFGETKVVACLRSQQKNGESRDLLAALGALWENGWKVNLDSLYTKQRRRVKLPAYPYEEQKFWVDSAKPGQYPSLDLSRPAADGGVLKFYRPAWKTQAPRRLSSSIADDTFMLILGSGSLVAQFCEELKLKNKNFLWIEPNGLSREISDAHINVDINSKNCFKDVLSTETLETVESLAVIIFPEENDGNLNFTLSYLIPQALSASGFEGKMQWCVVSSNLFLLPGDLTSNPWQVMSLGVSQVLPLEQDNIISTCIDFDQNDSDQDTAKLITDILHELDSRQIELIESGSTAREKVSIVALRHGRRYLRDFVDSELTTFCSDKTLIRNQATYIITGAFGGLGRALASYLAENFQANLLLVSRRHPDSEDKVFLESLSTFGSDVLTYSGDLSQSEHCVGTIEACKAKWQQVNGVFHLAGSAGGVLIQGRDIDEAEKVFNDKALSAYNLITALDQEPVDFVVFFSSLSGSIGMFGQSDYCSANAFLDLYAENLSIQMPVISIAWDAWAEVGMAADSTYSELFEQMLRRSGMQALAPEQGFSTLQALLSDQMPSQVMVSVGSLAEKQKQIAQIKNIVYGEPVGDDVLRSVRPEISVPYLAPDNDLERRMVTIWEESLGVNGIGVNDNFFELGGHSLLASRVVVRIREELDIKISLRDFFDSPSVAGACDSVTNQFVGQVGDDLLDQILTELEAEQAADD